TEALIALEFAHLILEHEGLTEVYGRRRRVVIRRALRHAVPRLVAEMAERFQARIDHHWQALCAEPCPGCGWGGPAADPAYRVGELLGHPTTRQQYLLCACCADARREVPRARID